MVRDGIYYAAGSLAAGLLVVWLGLGWLAAPLFLFGAFCLWFFRDPERQVPEGPVAVSPADGKVMSIVSENSSLTRISIFLNVFDVHVNRTPVGGVVREVQYHRGKFLVASKEAASDVNEQNTVVVETPDGVRVMFKQIAGLIARRVVFSRKAGDVLQAGERIGLMKFGSRMDVLFGPEWEITVKKGDRVRAAATVIARRRAH
jgi:phosphatidylserine decarboxylase